MKNTGMSIGRKIMSERIISLYDNYSPGTAGCMQHEDLKQYYDVGSSFSDFSSFIVEY